MAGCPGMKPGLGLKQLVRVAALPTPVGSIRQNPCFSSETQKCVPTNTKPRGCVAPATRRMPRVAAVPRVGLGVSGVPVPAGLSIIPHSGTGAGFAGSTQALPVRTRGEATSDGSLDGFVVGDQNIAGRWILIETTRKGESCLSDRGRNDSTRSQDGEGRCARSAGNRGAG